MKLSFALIFVIGITGILWAQQPQASKALPMPLFIKMQDSTTSVDVVFMLGKGGSISIDGRNTHPFNSFFEPHTTRKQNLPQAGTMMWEINGQEFLSGSFYLGDTASYVVITKNGKEYVNRISDQGSNFFKNQVKK